ncbi:unnamed protein product, partial [Ectocarpus sp. 4 AP-2014]
MLVTLACSNQGCAGSHCMYLVPLFGICSCCCLPALLSSPLGACVLRLEAADRGELVDTRRLLPTLRTCSGTLAGTGARLAAAAAAAAAGHFCASCAGVD